MSQRYFHRELVPQGVVELEDQEAMHLVKVMRAQVGEQVELFDGQGKLATTTIQQIKKKSVLLVIDKLTQHAKPADPKLTLVVAPPKGERLDLLLEKTTELGIDRLEFLQTTRTVVLPGSQKMQRLEQISIAACKQSGRLYLPELAALTNFKDWSTNESQHSRFIILADPQGTTWPALLQHENKLASAQEIAVCIGPEGGFTLDEIAELTQLNSHSIRIAEHILRIETAAVAFASCLAARFRA
jgi:16S rRNA (uracil1498-N3)-methyltransferase